MTYANNLPRVDDTIGRSRRVVTNCNDARGLQQSNKSFEDILSSTTLSRIMLSIRKWLPRFMWMERKYIPKENPSVDLLKNVPDDRCGALGHCGTNRWPLGNEIPALGMAMDMDIVCQCEPGATSATMAEISTYP